MQAIFVGDHLGRIGVWCHPYVIEKESVIH